MHVDLVKNEWAAGIQHRLAVIGEDVSGYPVLEQVDDPAYGEVLTIPVLMDDDHYLAPEKGQHVLAALSRHYSGSAVFATEAHDAADCPFASGPILLTGSHQARQAV